MVTEPAASDDAVLAVADALARFGPEVGLLVRDAGTRRPGLVATLRARLPASWLVVKLSERTAPRDLALDAVHLGGGPWTALAGDRPTSLALHDDHDAARAEELGAAVGLVSPIFETPGKGPARGLAAIVRARAQAPSLRLFALGGVTPANAAACVSAGADGVAVLRGVLHARDPSEAARAYLEAMGGRA